MNELFAQSNIPTDIFYTGKLFYACLALVEKDHFEEGSRLLLVHSGGLQGNRSLSPDVLCFT
jgi:1-aminocyclopropane-1-carboxylate deaminase